MTLERHDQRCWEPVRGRRSVHQVRLVPAVDCSCQIPALCVCVLRPALTSTVAHCTIHVSRLASTSSLTARLRAVKRAPRGLRSNNRLATAIDPPLAIRIAYSSVTVASTTTVLSYSGLSHPSHRVESVDKSLGGGAGFLSQHACSRTRCR